MKAMTIERFMTRVTVTEACWVFSGEMVGGYGRTWRNNRRILAHRYSYEHFVGPIPLGFELDHLCRNRACVRPDHLEPVTRAENIRRQRRDTCHKGHPREERPDGSRIKCRACDRVREAKRRERRRQRRMETESLGEAS